MDFGSLLYAAKKNDYNRKESKCYVTKFAPPKKAEKSKTLSINIQKFLAKKDEEEKLKALEARKKRDELLALRSQDGKAKKRVQAMLKRTKAANKSAISDAIDDNNTAVTIGGAAQPDEDDYGYVSQEASAFYNKLMDKYNSLPQEESIFSKKRKIVSKDLSSTKDRVKLALQKEEEEELLPHKRKRRTKEELERDGDRTSNSYDYESESQMKEETAKEKEKEKPKPKKMLPPPMDFQTLLKIAEQKQFEPVKIENKKEIKEEEHGRPMTKKQKAEYQKEFERQLKRQQINGKSNDLESIKNLKMHEDILHNIRTATSHRSKIPKLSDIKENESTPNKKYDDTKMNNSIKSSPTYKDPQNSKLNLEKSKQTLDSSKNNESKQKQYLPGDLRYDPDKNKSKSRQYLPGDLRYEGNKSKVNDSKNTIENNKQMEDRNRMLQNNDKKVLNKETVRSKQNNYDKSKNSLEKLNSEKKQSIAEKSKRDLNGYSTNQSNVSNEKFKENKKLDNTLENKPRERQYLPGDLRYKPNQKSNQGDMRENVKKSLPPEGRSPGLSNVKLKQDSKYKTDIKPRQFPPADMKPKQFPPPDMRSRQFPPKDVKRKPFKRRIESDDEYDSELDDFIDDGPEEGEDYSQHIREIFGYDKSRYSNYEDDGDECMESNFAQQLKEEFVSTKIGIMEDLEDIKMEQEEKKRKMLKMKGRR